jgi:mycobactin salicyl-AMP ligase
LAVYPARIRHSVASCCWRQNSAISSAAAVPLPDPYLGEKICAAVVFAGKPVTLIELNHHLDQRGVARCARPDMLIEMAALPTTAVGKVDKKAIARQMQR